MATLVARRLCTVFDHFGLLAPYYDLIFGGRRLSRRDLDWLLALVAPEPEHRLLDVGGGTGRIAQHFLGRVAQVCIVDPSHGMLRESLRKGVCAWAVDATQGESEVLPFADATFDRIIMIDAFHHLRDQQQAAREMVRALAPGGRLAIQEPDIAHWGVKMVALGEKVLLMRSHFFTVEEVGTILGRVDGVSGVHIERPSRSKTGASAWVVVDKV